MKKILIKFFSGLFLSVFILLSMTSISQAAQTSGDGDSNAEVGFYYPEEPTTPSSSDAGSNDLPVTGGGGGSGTTRNLPRTGMLIKWSAVGLGIGIVLFCILVYTTKLVRHLMFYYKKN